MSKRRNNYLSFEGKSQKDQYSVMYKVFPIDNDSIQKDLQSDDYKS